MFGWIWSTKIRFCSFPFAYLPVSWYQSTRRDPARQVHPCQTEQLISACLLCFCFPDNSVDSSRPVSSFSPQPWHSCHKLIYVRPNPKTGVPVGHWPIPESFWPDQNSPTLVSREASKYLSSLFSLSFRLHLIVLDYMSVFVLCSFMDSQTLLLPFSFIGTSFFL